MNPRLLEAAREGDINKLEILLNEDNYILDRSCLNASAETILHIAVLANQREFVGKLVKKKPELATRLNQDGFSAIHIASANGLVEIVSDFLKLNSELARLRSSDGRIALHIAAINGNVGVIRELLILCPSCKDDVTFSGENALHLAVKNSQFEGFKVMVEMLLRCNVEELLNAGDQDGNTVLHYAAAKPQIPTLRYVLGSDQVVKKEKMEVNGVNKKGLTALDVLDLVQQMGGDRIEYYEARDLLQRARAHTANNLPTVTSNNNFTIQVANNNTRDRQTTSSSWYKFFANETGRLNPLKYYKKLAEEVKQTSTETRNTLMIVATLVATVTFQPILNPPGGIYLDEEDGSFMAHMATNRIDFLTFMIPNSIGFFASLAVIIFIIHKFPLSSLLGLAARCMAASYICGIFLIGPTSLSSTRLTLLIVGCLVLVDIGRFIYQILSKCYNMIRYNDPEPPQVGH